MWCWITTKEPQESLTFAALSCVGHPADSPMILPSSFLTDGAGLLHESSFFKKRNMMNLKCITRAQTLFYLWSSRRKVSASYCILQVQLTEEDSERGGGEPMGLLQNALKIHNLIDRQEKHDQKIMQKLLLVTQCLVCSQSQIKTLDTTCIHTCRILDAKILPDVLVGVGAIAIPPLPKLHSACLRAPTLLLTASQTSFPVVSNLEL